MTQIPPVEAGLLRRPLFISPHLDDVVFSCGRLLASISAAGSATPVVATLFAGAPPPRWRWELTEWDRASGFQPGDDDVALRREEDRQALALLGARPVWIDLLDCQYGPEPALEEVVSQLRRLLVQNDYDVVFFPLGLFHSDHRLTREAAMVVAHDGPGCRWVVYEDALYRRLPGVREEAIAGLTQARMAPLPAVFTEAPEAASRKQRAVACYVSQLRGLNGPGRPGTEDLQAPEAYWTIAPLRHGRS